MKLEEMGERELLELLGDIFEEGPPVKVGIGDDGAAIRVGEETLVVTTDMLIEGVHFVSKIPPESVGRKAVVANLSDLAAMGSEPLALIYSLGAPKNTEVDFVSQLSRGMNSAARSYGTYLVGGDLSEAKQVVISGVAFGTPEGGEILRRSGARPGDLLGVTGELGATSAAVEAILSDVSLKGKKSLREALLKPEARIREGRILSKSGKVTSAIDVSDGLATDLRQIARRSGVGFVVDRGEIPVCGGVEEFSEEWDIDVDKFVLYGGEDFELLFTTRSDSWEELEDEFEKIGTEVSKIGEVTSEMEVYLRREGTLEELPDRGYDHFRR